ncbi:MAG: hypothetical protein K2X39_06430 [Silvanigrellaceae bacterium]|nr:hypothetical protein [Silvanigrellaceae bacterium]
MLSENLKIAELACSYARHHLSNGSTQMENNNLDVDIFEELFKSVLKMRKKINDRCEKYFFSKQKSLQDVSLSNFIIKVIISSSYGLGNCGELALLAFLYILRDYPGKRAEVMDIVNADHTFLVIGREIDSNISDPLSWGEDAVIVDALNDRKYSVLFIEDFLKYFRSEKQNGIRKNIEIDFKLTDNHTFKTTYDSLSMNIDQDMIINLSSIFIEKIKAIQTPLYTFRSSLQIMFNSQVMKLFPAIQEVLKEKALESRALCVEITNLLNLEKDRFSKCFFSSYLEKHQIYVELVRKFHLLFCFSDKEKDYINSQNFIFCYRAKKKQTLDTTEDIS